MRIIIIGGVAAGMSAAAKAKRNQKDAQVVVYEKGSIVSFGACGLPYYVGDFFSNKEEMIARTAEQFRESGVDVHVEHEVTAVNATEQTIEVKNLATGETFTDKYDRLMIATGAHAIIPPFENRHLGNIFTLKSMEDGEAVKAAAQQATNVVIIGAGYIGLEVVEAMHKLGKNTTLIQLDTRVLPDSFDKEVTDIMEESVRAHNVQLKLEERVQAFRGDTEVEAVITDKGEYRADLVVIATGVRPNTAFLKATGIDILDNGAVVVNEFGETSLPNVYAAGDCASIFHIVKQKQTYIPLATTANKLGRIVGENLTGKQMAFPGTLGSACVKVMDVEAGRTGLGEAEAASMGIDYKTVVIRDKNQTSYYPGQEAILVKLVYDANTKVILGGQAIGKKGAVLRVDVIAAMVTAKMTTNQLGMLDLCYAPPFARTWDVLNVAGNVAK